jgi:hypothetical protein
MIVIVLLLNILFYFAGFPAHPVHVSMCNLEFTDKASIIAVKLFSDDFGTVLKNKYGDDFVLTRANEEPYRKHISDYVGSNLKLTLNRNKSVVLEYDYSETNEGAIWIYFKADKPVKGTSLKIVNTLMLDLYEDQTNLVIMNQGGKQRGFQFTNQVRELEIELK